MSVKSTMIGCVAVLLVCGPPAMAETRVTLESAVRKGLVSVKVASRGGATGAAVRVDVQRQGQESLQVVVEPGTILVNVADDEQNMAVGGVMGELTSEDNYLPGEIMVLADRRSHSFLLEAYCLDYAKKAPEKGRSLSLASIDKRVARILAPPPDLNPSEWAVQLAIWMDRSGVTPERAMQIYPGRIAKVDIDAAHQLLAHAEASGIAEIPQDVPADVRVEIAKLYSPVPAIRDGAVEVLGQMGARARVAASYLVENILDRTTDKAVPLGVVDTVVSVATPGVDVEVAAEDLAARLKTLGLPGLDPLITSLLDVAAEPHAGTPLEFSIPGLPQGLEIRAPGVEISDGGIRIEGGRDLVSSGIGKPMLEKYIARLQDERPVVRKRAAWLLGTLRDPQAISPLIQALKDSDAGVRKEAAEALAIISGKDFGDNADKWDAWWREDQAAPSPVPGPAAPPAPAEGDGLPDESPSPENSPTPPEISLPPLRGGD